MKLTLADIALIAMVILAGILSAKSVWRSDNQKTAYIYKDDLLWGEYSLDKDRLIRIDAHNTVEIKNGKVAMIHADCPDKRCTKQGFSRNLPIICLPNKVLIEIKDREEDAPHILY